MVLNPVTKKQTFDKNEWRHQNTRHIIREHLVLKAAKSSSSDFLASLQKVSSTTGEMGRIPPKWKAPVGGSLKLNWGAAVNKQSKRMGIGIIVRDEEGVFVAAMAKVLPSFNDPTVAEALAAWHAVNMCVAKGFHKIVLEGDSLVVVSALNNSLPTWSSLGQLIEDTKVKAKSLHQVEISHVNRAANLAAHSLAKFAISQLLDELWIEECHSYIQSIVLAEQVSSYWFMRISLFKKKKKKKRLI
jgi:ribonuclease HI